VLDSRTLQCTPESGHRSGCDGAKPKKGSKVHAAVDTLGHLLALHVTSATEQNREQVGVLAEAVQEATRESVEWPTWIRATPVRRQRRRQKLAAFG
jgi:hypothetical protein